MALRDGYLWLPSGTTDTARRASDALLNLNSTDATIEIEVELSDYSADVFLITKDDVSGNGRTWGLLLNGAGSILLETFDDAGNSIKTFSVANGLTDGVRYTLQARIDYDDGASGSAVSFYQKAHGQSSFTLIGTDTHNAVLALNPDGTNELDIMGRYDFFAGTEGKCYQANIYTDLTQTTKLFGVNFGDAAAYDADKDAVTATGSLGGTVVLAGDAYVVVPTWNPDDFPILATAEAFWFAGDGNGDYGPSSINPWADLSGNNHHAVRGSGAQNPTFSTDHWVLLNGDRFEIAADASAFAIAAGQSFTLIARASMDDFGGPHLLFTDQRGGFDDADKGFNMFETGGGGSMKMEISDGTAGAEGQTGNVLTADVDYTFGFRRDVVADEVQTFVDGVATGSAGSDSSTGEISDGASGPMIGEEPSVANWDGRIYYVVWFRSALTDTQIANLQSELENFVIGLGPESFSFPFTIRPNRIFGNRVRTRWVERGHIESVAPDTDTTPN